jgi:thioredoxin reductase (NADPH)
MNEIYDLIILGGGPAGLTASIYASRAGLSFLLIERAYPGGQAVYSSEIDNYPGFPGISGTDLADRFRKHAELMGMQQITDEVTYLDLGEDIKTVHTMTGEYRTRNLLICTGASPRRLGIPGEEEFRDKGVSYCAACDGAFFKGRDAAVVGGGDTALTDAIYLAGICRTVTVIHRRGSFRGSMSLQNKLKEFTNVRYLMYSQPLAISGREQAEFLQVQTPDGIITIPVDGVFIAVGILPDSALVRGKLDTAPGGWILTDRHMRTSIAGVYAAGDVRETPLRQVLTAAADAAVAVEAIIST